MSSSSSFSYYKITDQFKERKKIRDNALPTHKHVNAAFTAADSNTGITGDNVTNKDAESFEKSCFCLDWSASTYKYSYQLWSVMITHKRFRNDLLSLL